MSFGRSVGSASSDPGSATGRGVEGMRSTPSRRLGFALVAGVCATPCACSGGESPAGAPPEAAVRFVAPVDARLLAEGSALRVEVWDAEQLALLDRNARCASVYDPATGKSEIRCPDGISYQAVTPEQFDLPVLEITGSVSLTSATVRVGERFRILLSGKSRDGCNRTSAEHSAVAEGAEVHLDGLAWTTTARACAGP